MGSIQDVRLPPGADSCHVTPRPLLSNWRGGGGVILGLPQDWPSHPPTQADPPTHPPTQTPPTPPVGGGGVPQSGGGLVQPASYVSQLHTENFARASGT